MMNVKQIKHSKRFENFCITSYLGSLRNFLTWFAKQGHEIFIVEVLTTM